jgi:hypothetical protein
MNFSNYISRRKVNVDQLTDIMRLLKEVPSVVYQLEKMKSMCMCEAFDVKISGMPIKLQKELKNLIKTVWMSTSFFIFQWKISVGIVPIFFKQIPETIHKIPIVPEIDQGCIYVIENKDRTISYEWEWKKYDDKTIQEPRVYFLKTGREPDKNGFLKTSLVSCLDLFDMLVKARTDLLYANYHLSHQMTIYEDKPPTTIRDDKVQYTCVDLFGKDTNIESDYETAQANHNEKQQFQRTKEFEDQLIRNGFINDYVTAGRYKGPALKSKPYCNDLQREIFLHNNIRLPVDRHFAGTIKPSTLIDIEKLEAKIAIETSEIIGIPLELTQAQSSKISSNKQGIALATAEILKSHIQWMNSALSEIYLLIYGETILKGWSLLTNGNYKLIPPKYYKNNFSHLKYEMELSNTIDIRVELKCDPRVNEQLILNFYQSGFISKQKTIEQLEQITGLTKGILEDVEPPAVILQKKEEKKEKNKNEFSKFL